MARRNKILKNLSLHLINKMLDGIDVIEDIIYPYKGFDPRKHFGTFSSYVRSLTGLEKNYLIIKNQDKFYLTLKGKLELIKYSDGKLKLKQPKWDGKWRIIGFDIPESKRDSRDTLREYLFYLGFRQLQKSIWITPLKINYNDLIDLFDEATKEKLVFFETDKISNEQDLKKLFDI